MLAPTLKPFSPEDYSFQNQRFWPSHGSTVNSKRKSAWTGTDIRYGYPIQKYNIYEFSNINQFQIVYAGLGNINIEITF